MRIRTDRILITQNGLRDLPQVDKMVQFVKAGGRFTRDARLAQSLLVNTNRGTPPPIHIALMEDGEMVLHDGHHRVVALFMGGREYIDPEEYETGHYKYADYTEAHPEKGWFTPFDLKTEVRLYDFLKFKNTARQVYETCGKEKLKEFISSNRNSYVCPRLFRTVESLASIYYGY